MQAGQLRLVRSDPSVDFTAACAQNAGISANLAFGVLSPCRIRGMVIESVQNLDWEVWLFGKNTFRTGAIGTESFRSRWSFVAGDGLQVAGTGLYAYYIDGLDAPYTDEDHSQQLHVLLVNRNAVAKIAGATGAIMVGFIVEETLGGA